MVKLVESGKVKPCKTIDLGCGSGSYAIYLASLGFDVTGIDISSSIIEIAKKNAKDRGMICNFIVGDVLHDLSNFKENFDFAYDWELLHHIFPKERKKHVKGVWELLNPGGKYFSVCFNENDPHFGGSGKYRKTPLGTTLYFSSEKEIKDLFKTYFDIIELKVIKIRGKPAPHIANYAFVKKE